MTAWDWIIVVGCWLLIPGVLVARVLCQRAARRSINRQRAAVLQEYREARATLKGKLRAASQEEPT